MFDKKYLKRVGIYIGGTALAIGIACYLGYHLWNSLGSEIETIPAIPETYSVTAEYDAWVFRDETAVFSAAGGTAVPSVRNGERVQKNSAVAQIFASVPSSGLAELETVRSQIRLLEGRHSSTLGGDLGIGVIMQSLTSAVKNGGLSSASEIASRLTALVSARSAGGGDTAAVIQSLEAREAELLTSFGYAAGTVYTPLSGWYYKDADGYESVFTPDAVEGITPDGLEDLLDSAPADVSSAAGRIVLSYKWYIAANMTASDGAHFAEGATTEVSLPGVTEPLTLLVESVVNGKDDRAAVVFSCGTIPESFDVGRHLTLEFTLDEVVGFGIPKEAVRIQDDVTGVYTYNGVMVKFRRIDIAAEYDDIYIAAVPVAEEEIIPAETAGTGEAETTASDPVGQGTGRKEYDYLSANEFIVVKGKALHSGRVIG